MPAITIDLDDDEAERLEHGVCDLLCWLRGYSAGRPEDDSNHPLGVEALRDLSIAIKDAREIEEAPPVFRRGRRYAPGSGRWCGG